MTAGSPPMIQPGRMRLRLAPSIANKIFAIIAMLLSLMAIVTAVNAAMSLHVGTLIGAINQTYLPAYGMLARSHIRALEQSFLLRRAVVATLANGADARQVADFLAAADAAGADAEAELAGARAALAEHVANRFRFDDQVLLGRLEAQIETIVQDRQPYNGLVTDLELALKAGDRPRYEDLLRRIDGVRDTLNGRTETTRRDMLALAANAVRLTQANQHQVIGLTLVTLAFAVLLGIVAAVRLTRGLVGSMRTLVTATEDVEKGRYGAELPVTSEDEIGRLARAFNLMVAELRLKEKIRDTFGKYVDPKIVEGLIDRPEITGSAGDRRTMTIYFCDMKGFTSLSEEITPASLVTILNRYFTLMSEEVRSRSGVVDKYIGDAVMAFWGPPFVAADQQGRLACEAALAQVRRFDAFRSEVPDLLGYRRFMPAIGIRIGIATGDVVVGNIGSAVAMNYTVIGETVNIASRIEGANKLYGTSILINEATAQLVRGQLSLREIDRIGVAGKTAPIAVYEVMGEAAAETPETAKLIEAYAEGLEAYRARDWPRAKSIFASCLEIAPGDGPAAVMLERTATTAPAGEWDGSWLIGQK